MDDVILKDSSNDELIIKDIPCYNQDDFIELEIHDPKAEQSLYFLLNIENAKKLIDTLQDLVQNAEHMND